MPGLPVGSFENSENSSDSWLRRATENLRRAFRAPGIRPSAANGAPLHFQAIDLSARHGRAQTFSVVVHAAILAALVFALISPAARRPGIEMIPVGGVLSYVPPLNPSSTLRQPSLGRGSGGENDPRPTRIGELAPGSSMPLVPPRLNHNEHEALPAPPAIFDANAPTSVPLVTHLGLPWMNRDTDSAGPGKHDGFGSGDGETMGDGDRNGAGEGDRDLAYANAASPVVCLYCPEPGYTDEARQAKLQGKLLLRVLVGADGKAQSVQILRGLGMGLDERAEETIRSWRFSPARDAAKRPVPAWVTVETHFQLF